MKAGVPKHRKACLLTFENIRSPKSAVLEIMIFRQLVCPEGHTEVNLTGG
jgi:hypothetical protein